MRYITGDEVGLLKVTLVPENQAAEVAPHRPHKKQRPGPEPPAPAKPTTVAHGTIDRNGEIQLMCFAGPDVVVVARKTGIVQYINLEDGQVLREHTVFLMRLDETGRPVVNKHKKSEHFVGIQDVEGTLMVVTDLGFLHIISPPAASGAAEPQSEASAALPAGTYRLAQDLLFAARFHPLHPTLLATGGDERDLTFWNLTPQGQTDAEAFEPEASPDNPVAARKKRKERVTLPPGQLRPSWTARNVKNDFLNIRVPIWITQLAFLDSTTTRVLVGTGYHQIRLYDAERARKPLFSIEVGTHPIRAMAVRTVEDAAAAPGGTSAVVSDTTGQMMHVGVDVKAATGKVLGKYAGLAGAVTSIAIPDGTDTVVTVGLDRFVKVFEMDGDRKLISKVYLKQRQTCVLADDPEAEAGQDGTDEGQDQPASDDEAWEDFDHVVQEAEEEEENEEPAPAAAPVSAKARGAPGKKQNLKRKKAT
ncbi:WD repeat-containing protein 74 [Thoreauomyces humboldtii]|nr:WD repeat-containing protein 74 [Thoreauomyces humboldtii]